MNHLKLLESSNSNEMTEEKKRYFILYALLAYDLPNKNYLLYNIPKDVLFKIYLQNLQKSK